MRCPPCGPPATTGAVLAPAATGAALLSPRPSERELELTTRCERDHDPEQCELLADLFQEGREGLAFDLVLAAKYAQLACEGGARFACRNLAQALWLGHGIPQDQRRALRLYEQLCQQDATRCVALGLALKDDGPLHDVHRAVVTFQRGCAARDSFACFLAGDLLTRRKEDLQAGVAFLETACDLGRSEGCERLAELHRRSGAFPDEARGRTALERACRLGAMTACDELHAKE